MAGLTRRDILLVSFPRSGNTWVRFFLCHLIDAAEGRDAPVDFTRLDAELPEFGVNDLTRPWRHASIDRFVKTHRRYLPLFRGRRAVLVVRDPRDVMRSYRDYEAQRTQSRAPRDMSRFVRDPRFGFPAWFRHAKSWLPHATVVIRYEDLRADDVGQFGKMFSGLGMDVDSALVRLAAERSRLGHVRSDEKRITIEKTGFGEGFTFAPDGGTGSWRGLLSDEDLRYYDDLKRKYAIDWY